MTRLLHYFEISQEYARYTSTRYEADERGELSPYLKRSVLSQDTLFELLEGQAYNPLAMYHFLSN